MQRSRKRYIRRVTRSRGTVAALLILFFKNTLFSYTVISVEHKCIDIVIHNNYIETCLENNYIVIYTHTLVSCAEVIIVCFAPFVFQGRFDGLEREIRAEFQNLHRFLDEEECNDLERLGRERQKQLKQLKEREKKIAEQGRNLERAITVLNSKLAEEDSPKLLKVRKCFI